MFEHFKPYIIKEIANAWSRVSLSFNGWGLKHKKILVVGVVIYIINERYKNITRLIGLLELSRHRKKGVGKLTLDLYLSFNTHYI
jgi:hypothetical protein